MTLLISIILLNCNPLLSQIDFYEKMIYADSLIEDSFISNVDELIDIYESLEKVYENKVLYYNMAISYSINGEFNKSMRYINKYIKIARGDLKRLHNDKFIKRALNRRGKSIKYNKILSSKLNKIINEDIRNRYYNNPKIPSVFGKISKKEYDRDINLLLESINLLHSGKNLYITDIEFSDKVDSIIDKYKPNNDSINIIEVYKSVIAITELVKCGHTSVTLNKKQRMEFNDNRLFFPYPIRFISGQLYCYMEQNEIPNIKISKINDTPIKEVLELSNRDMYGDGDSYGIGYYDYEYLFSTYLNLYYLSENDTCVEIEYINMKSGDLITTEVELLPYSTQRKNFAKVYKRDAGVINYKLRENYAILDINTFVYDTSFNIKYEYLFDKVIEDSIHNLIVDLRGNLGGYYSNVYNLLSYFTDSFSIKETSISNIDSIDNLIYHTDILERDLDYQFKTHFKYDGYDFKFRDKYINPYKVKSNKFNGRVFILIDGKSFSGSTVFANIMMNNYKDVTIIGEESGGGLKGLTAYYNTTLTLPNSKIEVLIPMVSILMDNEACYEGLGRGVGGIIPDIYVTYSYEDFISDIDKEIIEVINLIK